MDYFASRYVTVRDKLERNFSGGELNAQMEKLDAAYKQGMSTLVDGYAEKIKSQLNLSDGQAQTVQDSLQAHLDQKIAGYQMELGQVEQPAGDDAWL